MLPRERLPADMMGLRLVQQSRAGFISTFIFLVGYRSVRQAERVVGTS